jgi:hypothetical protein
MNILSLLTKKLRSFQPMYPKMARYMPVRRNVEEKVECEDFQSDRQQRPFRMGISVHRIYTTVLHLLLIILLLLLLKPRQGQKSIESKLLPSELRKYNYPFPIVEPSIEMSSFRSTRHPIWGSDFRSQRILGRRFKGNCLWRGPISWDGCKMEQTYRWSV